MENIYPKLMDKAPSWLFGATLHKDVMLRVASGAFLSSDAVSLNDTNPTHVRVWNKDVLPGELLDTYITVHSNGVIVLDHHNHITHKTRKIMNSVLPLTIRVILRKKKFFVLDEDGNKCPFESSVVIAQGKVNPI